MLLSFHRNKTHKTVAEILRILAALLLAASCLAALLSQFQLSFSTDHFFSGGLKGGFFAVWNHIADVMGNTSYTILPVYDGAGDGYGLFLLVTFLVLAAAAYLIVRSRIRPLIFLFLLPQFLIALLFPLQPEPGFTVFCVAAVLFALCVMTDPAGIWKAVLCAALPAIAAAILLLSLGPNSPALRGNASGKTDLGVKAADALYGTTDLGNGDLTARERTVRDGEALSVTMSKPQSMYLKGFTGALFAGDSWTDLSDGTYYQAKDLMDALSEDGYYAPGALAKAAEVSYGELPKNEITVKNTGADSRILYVPYDMTDSGTLGSLSVKGGTEFYPGYLNGVKTYQFTAAENQVDNWTDAASRFYTIALSGGETTEGTKQTDGSGKKENAGDKQTEESGKTSVSASQRKAAADLLRQESHFNTFVYENFTFLTPAERRLFAETIGSSGDQSKGHMDYKLAIETIRSYLDENFIYTEDLGAKSSGNALEDFLTSHKGYDMHFATAATLMFRYFGIPARYAEGYLITPGDVAGVSSGQAISVPRERVHAWCEIYVDGVGFVPLEVTPEFYGIMEEADLNVGLSNKALMQEFQDLYGGDTTEEEDETPPEVEDVESVLSLVYLVLAVLAALAVLTGLFFLIRRMIRVLSAASARRKLFYQSDPKTAVAAIYGYMEEQNLTPDAETVALGNLAAYSRNPIPEEAREKMLVALKRLKKEKTVGRE